MKCPIPVPIIEPTKNPVIYPKGPTRDPTAEPIAPPANPPPRAPAPLAKVPLIYFIHYFPVIFPLKKFYRDKKTSKRPMPTAAIILILIPG